eukprot:TRINITY_DN4164_c0_g1_i3.p1 TRINITY_DN4164_c0_g1~~TRINITY_DN4164_c0_g1_i3.p1  ORF type:complete len:331 (+),score=50.72 TRINITY_DN4164_c0_g1_i3:58-1050(+)
MASVEEQQYQLAQPPTDGISCVRFARNSNLLLASSWDKGIRIYDAANDNLLSKFEQAASVLDCVWAEDDTRFFCGGLEKTVSLFDSSTGVETKLCSHEKAIKSVEYSIDLGAVISGSFDKTVAICDPRSARPSTVLAQPGKVFTMTVSSYRLVVGTSDRHVYIYDLRNPAQPEQRRLSSLRHQTRCIKAFPDGAGYVLSSIEGRVAVEYFDPSPASQAKKYAFKCHRTSLNNTQYVFPVNAIAFHPGYGTFATGGCDGVVNVWDGELKKRVCQYPNLPTSVASLDFNATGSLLAIASSYTYEEDDKDHPADAIYIRKVLDHEVRPKSKSK